MFTVKCANAQCYVRPSVTVGGECGYDHMDKYTNLEAKYCAIEAWQRRD
jgi:hypothetical protein